MSMPSIHNSVESSKCLELLHLQALSNHTRKASRLGLWGEQMIQTRHGQATPHMLITFADGTSELILILEDKTTHENNENGLPYLKKQEREE